MDMFNITKLKPHCVKAVALEKLGLIEVYTMLDSPGNIMDLLMQIDFIDVISLTIDKVRKEINGEVTISGGEKTQLKIIKIDESTWIDIFWLDPDAIKMDDLTIVSNFDEFKKVTNRVKIMIKKHTFEEIK